MRAAGLLSALAFSLLVWALVIASVASVASVAGAQTRTMDPYGWRGVVKFCIIDGSAPPQCELMRTNNTFDTREQCAVETPRRAALGIEAVRREQPELLVKFDWTCVQDRTAPNI